MMRDYCEMSLQRTPFVLAHLWLQRCKRMVADTAALQVAIRQLNELVEYSRKYEYHQIELECQLILCSDVNLKRLKDVPRAIIDITNII